MLNLVKNLPSCLSFYYFKGHVDVVSMEFLVLGTDSLNPSVGTGVMALAAHMILLGSSMLTGPSNILVYMSFTGGCIRERVHAFMHLIAFSEL